MNIRSIAVVLANMFWNQIKLILRERVVYDRDLFNYEEYVQKGLNDSRLVKNVLFMPANKGSKSLVAEFFKFHKSRLNVLQDGMLSLNTADKVLHNLNLIAMHADSMYMINRDIDIEPLLLVLF